jgi:hypothetical protein
VTADERELRREVDSLKLLRLALDVEGVRRRRHVPAVWPVSGGEECCVAALSLADLGAEPRLDQTLGRAGQRGSTAALGQRLGPAEAAVEASSECRLFDIPGVTGANDVPPPAS